MKSTQHFLKLVASIVVLAAALPSDATIIFFDTFENGSGTSTKLDDAFDPNDVSWYSALSNGTAVLVNDVFAGSGSAKALELNSPDTFRRMGAHFPSTTLGTTVGDKLILSFAFRLAETPANNVNGFRFGLYNSGGTFTTSDNAQGTSQPTAQNNDSGYYVVNSTGPAAATAEIRDEASGDNPTGGTIAGIPAFTTSTSPLSINDQTLHTLQLSIERTGASSVLVSYVLDNVTRASGTDSSPFLTFDTVYFAKGNITTNFRLDNVRLESVLVVPEPGSFAILLIGLVGGLRMAGTRRYR